MRRAKDVIGLTILSLSSGRKLGSVKDVLFDPETNRILAVLVDEGGWFDKARVVPFGSIRSFGRDAVIVPDDTVVVPADSDPVIKRALDRGKVVVGMEVYTTDGRYLGKIDEFVFAEQTGQVQGFEISGGPVAETLRGKPSVSAAETRATGLQVAFVPPETGTRVEREVTGGLAAAAEEARRRGEEVAAEARQRLERAREEAARMGAEQQKRFVVGKRAESTVQAPDGTVIVAAGEIISEAQAAEAERRGVLPKLVQVASAAEARRAAGGLQEELQRVFEDLRRTFTGAGAEAQRQAEEARIKRALGRPVTRVILDQQDRVILNVGDIVTHEAIRRAREAGVLDVLLESVAKREPEIAVSEWRAPTPGEASLEQREKAGAGAPTEARRS